MMVGELMASLRNDDQRSLRRAFQIWLSKVLFPRLREDTEIVNDLWGDEAVLYERARQWEREWRLQGRKEGEAALLRRQLLKRFGQLPQSVSDRLDKAQPEQIECWGERLLDARRLSDVFDR